jgi:predicted RNA binding protein YcfA (HicA-like mRNA interferase family)
LHTEFNKRGDVKRKEILKKLAEAGFTFVEGGEHTKAYDPKGRYRATIGRHTEIKDNTAKKIEKQTGVKLL